MTYRSIRFFIVILVFMPILKVCAQTRTGFSQPTNIHITYNVTTRYLALPNDCIKTRVAYLNEEIKKSKDLPNSKQLSDSLQYQIKQITERSSEKPFTTWLSEYFGTNEGMYWSERNSDNDNPTYTFNGKFSTNSQLKGDSRYAFYFDGLSTLNTGIVPYLGFLQPGLTIFSSKDKLEIKETKSDDGKVITYDFGSDPKMIWSYKCTFRKDGTLNSLDIYKDQGMLRDHYIFTDFTSTESGFCFPKKVNRIVKDWYCLGKEQPQIAFDDIVIVYSVVKFDENVIDDDKFILDTLPPNTLVQDGRVVTKSFPYGVRYYTQNTSMTISEQSKIAANGNTNRNPLLMFLRYLSVFLALIISTVVIRSLVKSLKRQ